ncbi:shikimate kinase [Curtanaerobium respiraculi]|uniref:shikimate kinase n=1 Tax=Curtanaerobium respiraculi TaxID=2949669 RepID=UPI0024B3723E|nr:shikimate kinase [Curtanaerobium respiraculi]
MAGTDNIILIGMPGSGKSTLGVVLAKIIGYDFLDVDILMQNQCGTTLPKLIEEKGAEGFIEVEGDVAHGIEAERTVISPGGSIVYSDAAMRHLAEIGTIVYLRISLEELEIRLGGLHERGVVMREGMGELMDIYRERLPLYERYAEVTLDVDGLTVRDAAAELVERLSLTALR